jgi:hypothetical protein
MPEGAGEIVRLKPTPFSKDVLQVAKIGPSSGLISLGQVTTSLATLVSVCRLMESRGHSRVVCLHSIDIDTFGALVPMDVASIYEKFPERTNPIDRDIQAI